MNYFIFLSLAISIAVGIPPDTDDLPLFDYDYGNNGVTWVRPQIGGNSEFPAIESYPWMVSFGEYRLDNQTLKWKHYCGGAIISKFGIATASHCFYGRDHFKTHTKIRVGDQNFTDTTDDVFAETYEILTILKHPGYGGSGPKNDLAIVFTDREIEFNLTVNSINLPSAINPAIDGSTNQSAKFSGWGWFNGSNIVSEALRATNFTIFTGEYCEQQFNNPKIRNHLENTTIMFCAGTDDTSSWSCSGDSGSPLVIETSPQEHTLVGILHGSSLSTCVPGNNRKVPGLFANLEHEDNLDFIEKWLPLGEYFASQDTNDTDIFYLKKLDPHLRFQYLWREYPYNEEVYAKVFFDVCQDSTYLNDSLDTYGMNCSLYNSMVYKVCQNGQSELDNFEKFNVNCSFTKMLVVSGDPWGSSIKTELIDIGRPNIICDLPDFPIQVAGAVGFNSAKGPTICGGSKSDGSVTNECFTLNYDHQWESLTKMTTTRFYTSVTQIDSDEVLLIGGYDEAWTDFRSTEIVSFSGSEASEDLPFTIVGHCTLKINATTALITGGEQDGQYGSAATWFLDLFTFKTSPGPILITGREFHGCTTLNLGGKNYGIITGGREWKPFFRNLDTTEILDLQDLQANNAIWKPGPKLPRELELFPLLTTNQGVILVGGFDNNGWREEIIQLYCQDDIIENCQWQEIEQKLQNPRGGHVVIPLPETYDICT